MRFAIIGAGGVGGSLGAALLRAGHEVLFVARGRNARALARRGLAVVHGFSTFRAAPVDVTSDPAGQPPADVALLCMKCYDLDTALESHANWLSSCNRVVTLQNGLTAPQAAARVIPPERVWGGTAQVVARLMKPGVILREGKTLQLDLAESGEGVSDRLQRFRDAMASTGIATEIHHDMETMLWRKFLMVACSSSINAATRSGFDAMARNPAMPWLLEAALQEALGVAQALEIPLPGDIEAQTRAALGNVFACGGKASLLVDLERGRPLELEWLSGAIHRMGERTGAPTPLHTAVYRKLLPVAGGRARQSRSPAPPGGGTRG